MKLLRALAVGFLLAGPVSAQDVDKGVAALQADDYAAALSEWRPLAERGNTRAQQWLAYMYAAGKGVPQDYAEAIRWYKLAAEQGDGSAIYKLGQIYFKGEIMPQDYAESSRWYRLGAEQGHSRSQSSLGAAYKFGRGVPQDYITAHMWYNVSTSALAALARDGLAGEMSFADILEAQRRARVCLASNYQDCG